MTDIGWMAG